MTTAPTQMPFRRRLFAAHWPALLAWLALPALILALPRAFHGNDDTLMVEMLRSGHPAPFLGDAMSVALAFLYSKVSLAVPWYGLLLYVTTCAGGHAGWRVLQIITDGPGWVRIACRVAASLVLLFTLWMFTSRLTFTITSITACGVAFIAFAVECRHGSLTWRRGLAYGLLAAIGSMWRPEGVFATAAALGLPAVAFLAWFVWNKRQTYAVAFLACAAPIALGVAANNLAPMTFSQEEVAYREYNAARGAIQGFDKYSFLDQRNPDGVKEAGWSKWNYRALMLMINFNEDRFPLERLRALQSAAVVPGKPPLGYLLDLSFGMSIFAWILPAGALGMSLLFGAGPRAKTWGGVGLILMHLCYMVAVMAYFALTMRIVPRIAMPILLVHGLATAAMGWWIMGPDWLGAQWTCVTARTNLWPRARIASAALLLAGLLPFAVRHWILSELSLPIRAWQWHPTLAQALRKHVPDADRKIFVEYACITGFASGVDPLLSADPMPFRTVFLEWVPPSPFFYECLKTVGIPKGKDLMAAGHDRPEETLFLIDEMFVMQFENYAQGELGKVVHFEKAYDIGWTNLDVYRLVDGPSTRFELPGCPKGSIFRIGTKIEPIPCPPPEPVSK